MAYTFLQARKICGLVRTVSLCTCSGTLVLCVRIGGSWALLLVFWGGVDLAWWRLFVVANGIVIDVIVAW